MSKNILNINTANTFQEWVSHYSTLSANIRSAVVTTDNLTDPGAGGLSNTGGLNSGNSFFQHSLVSNNLFVVTTLKGGTATHDANGVSITPATLAIGSNVNITGVTNVSANVNFSGAKTLLGQVANVAITGGSTNTFIRTTSGASGTLVFSYITATDLANAMINMVNNANSGETGIELTIDNSNTAAPKLQANVTLRIYDASNTQIWP